MTESITASSCVTVMLRVNIWLIVVTDNYKTTSHFIVTLKITSNHVKLTCGHANGCDGIRRCVVWQKFSQIFREKFSRRLQILPKRLLAECIASCCIFLCISCITGTSDGDVVCAALSCFTPETTGRISTKFGTGVKFRFCKDFKWHLVSAQCKRCCQT